MKLATKDPVERESICPVTNVIAKTYPSQSSGYHKITLVRLSLNWAWQCSSYHAIGLVSQPSEYHEQDGCHENDHSQDSDYNETGRSQPSDYQENDQVSKWGVFIAPNSCIVFSKK